MTLNSTDTRVDHTTNAKYADNRAELRGTRGIAPAKTSPSASTGFRGASGTGWAKGPAGEVYAAHSGSLLAAAAAVALCRSP